jgi:hypothetical protein
MPIIGGSFPMPQPSRLTDDELSAVLAAAAPITVARRETFLQAVADSLRGRELGPGVVYRVVSETQPTS